MRFQVHGGRLAVSRACPRADPICTESYSPIPTKSYRLSLGKEGQQRGYKVFFRPEIIRARHTVVLRSSSMARIFHIRQAYI